MAFFDALSSIEKEQEGEVPNHLRDASRDKDGFGHGEGYLYPHAYRDHWVAQQYLPESLMGKLFFQPSDQGYEKSIRDRVQKFRESQIEAMAGAQAMDPFAGAGGSDEGAAVQWIKRTAGTTGASLDRIRDRLFEMSGIGRESLVLDLHGRTGLLVFQAVRVAVEGNVWAFAYDDREYETLVSLSREIDDLHKPQILRATLDDFDAKLFETAGKGVAFDAIVGRHIIASIEKKPEVVRRIAKLTAAKGIIALAEPVASEGQRISALADFSGTLGPWREALHAAEESVLTDPDDPMVNWNAISLEKTLSSISGIRVKIVGVEESVRRRLSAEDISHWFRSAPKGMRPSLGDRLEKVAGKKAREAVEKGLHGQLDNKEVSWKTVTAYIKITKSAANKKKI
jgi:putative ATPase